MNIKNITNLTCNNEEEKSMEDNFLKPSEEESHLEIKNAERMHLDLEGQKLERAVSLAEDMLAHTKEKVAEAKEHEAAAERDLRNAKAALENYRGKKKS